MHLMFLTKVMVLNLFGADSPPLAAQKETFPLSK